jgi:hypothetical protein
MRWLPGQAGLDPLITGDKAPAINAINYPEWRPQDRQATVRR